MAWGKYPGKPRLALHPAWGNPALQFQWKTKLFFFSYREVPHPRVCVQVRDLGITSCRKQGKEGEKGGSTGGIRIPPLI